MAKSLSPDSREPHVLWCGCVVQVVISDTSSSSPPETVSVLRYCTQHYVDRFVSPVHVNPPSPKEQ